MKYIRLLLAGLFLISTAGVASAADTFGSTTGTLPNVTNLNIYRLDPGAADKTTGGTLLDSGLNKTFQISQDSESQYRFSFRVKNDGQSDWTVDGADLMFHEGLNGTGWTVTDIWYNLSTDMNDGTFSDSGKVSWNTNNGGTLNSGDAMWAKYIINISQPRTVSFNQSFVVNDTSDSLDLTGYSGSQDYHKLNVTKYGFLDVELDEPPQDTVLTQNESFVMNASVTCREGECGSVDLSIRYNESANSADTLIPQDTNSEPFNTNTSNTKTCSSNLGFNETCRLTWFVNASGPLESYHLLDANASSDASQVEANDSEDKLVQINTAIILNLEFDEIDFGPLDPGATDKPAENNSDLQYNVTVDAQSQSVDNLWVRSEDLNSSKFPRNYSIPAENLSYSLTNDIGTENFLSNDYQKVTSSISPGTTLTTYYWIDVPFGIYNGFYTGSIYYKANSTVS